jgi:hypothetical protein
MSWLEIQVERRRTCRSGRIAIAERVARKRRLTPMSSFSLNNGTDIAGVTGRERHEFWFV